MTRRRKWSGAALAALLGCGGSEASESGEGTETEAGTVGSTSAGSMSMSGSATGEPGTSADSTADSTATTDASDTATTTGDASSESTAADAPEIDVEVEGMAVGSGETYDFGMPVDVGATGAAVTVTITNSGSTVLTISDTSLSGPAPTHFVLDDTSVVTELAPDESTGLTVAFAPTNGGDKSTELSIASDDADEDPYIITFEARTTPNTWRPITPMTAPEARFNTALADLEDGRVLLFGGRLGNGMRVADTWVFDPETGDWSELSPASSPSARSDHAMASVGGGVVVLFGGTETSGPSPNVTPRNDTWTFDVATEEWTELSPAVLPTVRFNHGLARSGDGTALLFGGRIDFAMELADVWELDVETMTWAELMPLTSPGPRSAFGMAYDGVDAVTIVGGTPNSNDIVDEVWTYSIAAGDWDALMPAGGGTQFNNAAAYVGDTLVTFGGKADCCSDPSLPTFGYDPVLDAWSSLSPAGEPPSRFAHSFVGVGNGKAIMFGGVLVNADPSSAVSETWEYVGP